MSANSKEKMDISLYKRLPTFIFMSSLPLGLNLNKHLGYNIKSRYWTAFGNSSEQFYVVFVIKRTILQTTMTFILMLSGKKTKLYYCSVPFKPGKKDDFQIFRPLVQKFAF